MWWKVLLVSCAVAARNVWAHAGWERIDGTLDFVAVGRAGVWGVRSDDDYVYYRTGIYENEASSGTGWGLLTNVNADLEQISSGMDTVWGVGRSGEVWARLLVIGVDSDGLDGSWPLLENKNNAQRMKQVYVSSTSNQVWGIDVEDRVRRRTGIMGDIVDGDGWETIDTKLTYEEDGDLKFVSVGRAGVWAVNSKGKVFHRTGTFENEDSSGTGWKHVGGVALKQISSGNGEVWVTTIEKLKDSDWQEIEGRLKQVYVSSSSNQVWGVMEDGSVYRRIR
ncbi:hypothetical protein Bbelb_321680 [Branchiostoma belcheri]|nr:hypothetical protein Bbelb_321680 [Branchiostoma belcheri]